MSFEDNVQAIGDQAADRVVELWGMQEAGSLTMDEFIEAATVTVATAREQGATLGAVTQSAYLSTVTGESEDVYAPDVETNTGMLALALGTVVVSNLDTVMQLTRLAKAETHQAAQGGMQDAIRQDPKVVGWTRGLNGSACDFCRDHKASEGDSMPKDSTMAGHAGCTCTPTPVLGIALDQTRAGGTVQNKYRRGQGWLTERQANEYDATGKVPPLDAVKDFTRPRPLTPEEQARLTRLEGKQNV